jgi:hypothetical protein
VIIEEEVSPSPDAGKNELARRNLALGRDCLDGPVSGGDALLLAARAWAHSAAVLALETMANFGLGQQA